MWKSSGDCETVRMRRHRNCSSDDVGALRRQADQERKRAAYQQATDTGANLMAQRYRVWSMDRQRERKNGELIMR